MSKISNFENISLKYPSSCEICQKFTSNRRIVAKVVSWECGGSCNPATRRLVMMEGLRTGVTVGAGLTLTGRPR